MWTGWPLDWGAQAESHLDHPAEHATAPQWMTRATALFDAMRNAESEQAFARVLAAPGLETRRALEISGLDRHFAVHESLDDALAASL